MKKIILALMLIFVLASCNQGSSDGYRFENVQRLNPEREIRVVLHKSIADVNIAFRAQQKAPALPDERELQAFSVITSKTCTIHMVDPAVRYMPEFFGHELVHCLYGEFHPSQNGQ